MLNFLIFLYLGAFKISCSTELTSGPDFVILLLGVADHLVYSHVYVPISV